MLTRERINQLQDLAIEVARSGRSPVGTLMRLADDWNEEYSTLAREFAGLQHSAREELRDTARTSAPPKPVTSGASRLTPINKPHESTSPFAGIKAAPGSLHQQGINWPLVDARIRSGLGHTDIGRLLNPPLSGADYKRVEEGRLLPSADQIAQLCTLLEISPGDAFILAGPDAPQPGVSRGTPIKGFSVLGVLRARRRLSFKALSEEIHEATGVTVPPPYLTKLERAETHDKGRPDPHEKDWREAVAMFFDLPASIIDQKIPPAMVQRAAQNTRQLHEAIKTAAKALPVVELDRPQLLGGGSEK